MQAQLEPQRDNFDEWLSQVLTAGANDALPSAQVWGRIARGVRATLIRGRWRRHGNSQSFGTWAMWYEQRRRRLDMQIISLSWELLYSRPLSILL